MQDFIDFNRELSENESTRSIPISFTKEGKYSNNQQHAKTHKEIRHG